MYERYLLFLFEQQHRFKYTIDINFDHFVQFIYFSFNLDNERTKKTIT